MNTSTWNKEVISTAKVSKDLYNPESEFWKTNNYIDPEEGLEALTPFWCERGLPQNVDSTEGPDHKSPLTSLTKEESIRWSQDWVNYRKGPLHFPLFVIQWYRNNGGIMKFQTEAENEMELCGKSGETWAQWWHRLRKERPHDAFTWLSIWFQMCPFAWIQVVSNKNKLVPTGSIVFWEEVWTVQEEDKQGWLRNWFQQMTFQQEIPEDNEYWDSNEVRIRILYSQDACFLTEFQNQMTLNIQRWMAVSQVTSCFHGPTRDWMVWIPPLPATDWSFFLTRIWIRWMCYNIPWKHRMRFLWSGGMVKNAYHIREVSDVDFWVMDHDEVMEQYYPKLHHTERKLRLFQDFGRTYYACEEYFFPMQRELYMAQNEYKIASINSSENEDENGSDSPRFGTHWVPNYSASGLKVARFSTIFRWLWGRYHLIMENAGVPADQRCPTFESLDNWIITPQWGFYRWGIKHAPLEGEFLRDHIKDLDLGFVSAKQRSDWFTFHQMYRADLDQTWWNALGITDNMNKVSNPKDWRPLPILRWSWNLYHGDDVCSPEGIKLGVRVLIRRCPLFIHQTVTTLLEQGKYPRLQCPDSQKEPWRWSLCSNGVIVHNWNDKWTKGRELTHYRQVLWSSLPIEIEYCSGSREKGTLTKRKGPAVWSWILTAKGEFHIQLITHPWGLGSTLWHLADGEPFIASGMCQMVMSAKNGLIMRVTLHRHEESSIVFGSTPEQKVYRQKIVQLLKVIFQTHRIHDVMEDRSIAFEFVNGGTLDPDWEAMPWIEDERRFWEAVPWCNRWIPFPGTPEKDISSLLTKWQEKHGWSSSENPTDIWKKRLRPKIRTTTATTS